MKALRVVEETDPQGTVVAVLGVVELAAPKNILVRFAGRISRALALYLVLLVLVGVV